VSARCNGIEGGATVLHARVDTHVERCEYTVKPAAENADPEPLVDGEASGMSQWARQRSLGIGGTENRASKRTFQLGRLGRLHDPRKWRIDIVPPNPQASLPWTGQKRGEKKLPDSAGRAMRSWIRTPSCAHRGVAAPGHRKLGYPGFSLPAHPDGRRGRALPQIVEEAST
jgi:hypothetical protein